MADAYDEYEDDFEDETPPPTPGDGAVPPPIGVNLAESTDDGYADRSPSSVFPWTLITLDELDVETKLAAGAMGAVHAGYHRGRPVAIKTLHDTSSAALSAVEAELQVHASLRDRRIVELIGANLVPPGCCIVMEQCERSLFEKLHRRPEEMSRRQSVGIAIQVRGDDAAVARGGAREPRRSTRARIRPHAPNPSRCTAADRRWRRPWPSCTRDGRPSSTATSSRTTCCSTQRAMRSCATLAW